MEREQIISILNSDMLPEEKLERIAHILGLVEEPYPCKYCHNGWGSISTEDYKSCHDYCDKFKKWQNKA